MHLNITPKEFCALMETAETCLSAANCAESGKEAKKAVRAYKSVLKRHNLPPNFFFEFQK